MKAKHQKQRRKNTIVQPCPQPTTPAPPAEGESTDRQTSGNPFHLPIYINMFCLVNPADPNSKFKIEHVMLWHRSMGAKLDILPEWIKKVAALQASEGGASISKLISSGKLISPGWPPILRPEALIAAWLLNPKAIAEVNAAYPGAIYTEPRFIEAIRRTTLIAANGDTPEKRNAANDWLRTAFAVPPPQRKLSRRSKTKLGRSAKIYLSSIHIWSICTLYQDIVKARTVYSGLLRSREKLLRALPELLDVRSRKPEWFNKIVPTITRPINAVCEIIASIPESGLHGHKPASIRKAFERLTRKTNLNLIPQLEKFSREGGKKIVEEFNKSSAEVSTNVTP